MPALDLAAKLCEIRETAARHPGLRLLVAFGSRARGDDGPASDWDVGFIAREPFDPLTFRGALASVLASDAVDLVDLENASGLLRYRAARDGKVVFEARPEIFARFWLEAVDFWCDVAPILERGYESILQHLGP